MEGFDMEGEEEEEEEEDVRRSGEAGSEVLDSSAVAFPQSDDEEISTDGESQGREDRLGKLGIRREEE